MNWHSKKMSSSYTGVVTQNLGKHQTTICIILSSSYCSSNLPSELLRRHGHMAVHVHCMWNESIASKKLPTFSKSLHKLPWVGISSQRLPKVLKNCQKLPWVAQNCHKSPGRIVNHRTGPWSAPRDGTQSPGIQEIMIFQKQWHVELASEQHVPLCKDSTAA